MEKKKIIRISNIPQTMNLFCKGLFKELSANYEVVAVSSPEPALKEIEEREGIRTIAVPIERRMAPLKDIVTLYRLIKVFRKERPNLVHSVGLKAALLGMCAAYLTKVEFRVHTFTGLAFPTATGAKRALLKWIDKMICSFATHLLPEGRGVERDLLQAKITKKPLKVLGNGNIRGIDLEYYKISQEVEREAAAIKDSENFTFLFVGRIVAAKGINELVEAFVRLNSELPATRLILVGGYDDGIDPISAESRKIIKTHNKIVEAGVKEDVRPWYVAADCFILPSYREGFPNVVIEAGAMGLPSIVTDINGANEIIIEGENGIIIPPQNAEALYSAMKEIVTNEATRQKMAGAARSLIASRYEQSYVYGCLKEFYASLLNPQSPK